MKSNADRLYALFGGINATSRATGIDVAVVHRWGSNKVRGCRGHIPARFNTAVMKAARKAGFPAQAKLLLNWQCPVCGGPLKDG